MKAIMLTRNGPALRRRCRNRCDLRNSAASDVRLPSMAKARLCDRQPTDSTVRMHSSCRPLQKAGRQSLAGSPDRQQVAPDPAGSNLCTFEPMARLWLRFQAALAATRESLDMPQGISARSVAESGARQDCIHFHRAAAGARRNCSLENAEKPYLVTLQFRIQRVS